MCELRSSVAVNMCIKCSYFTLIEVTTLRRRPSWTITAIIVVIIISIMCTHAFLSLNSTLRKSHFVYFVPDRKRLNQFWRVRQPNEVVPQFQVDTELGESGGRISPARDVRSVWQRPRRISQCWRPPVSYFHFLISVHLCFRYVKLKNIKVQHLYSAASRQSQKARRRHPRLQHKPALTDFDLLPFIRSPSLP